MQWPSFLEATLRCMGRSGPQQETGHSVIEQILSREFLQLAVPNRKCEFGQAPGLQSEASRTARRRGQTPWQMRSGGDLADRECSCTSSGLGHEVHAIM